MKILNKLSIASAVTIILASTSVTAFAGKTERGTVLADDYNRQVYGDREYQYYHKHEFRQTPVSIQHYKRGIHYFEKGETKRAERAFKRSLGGSIYYKQANAYLGLVNIEQDQHKSAIRYLKRAVRENPDMHALKAVLGLSYVEVGKEEKASEILTQLKEYKTDSHDHSPEACVLNESITQLEQALLKS